MKIILICIILIGSILTSYPQDFNKFNFKGDVDYTQHRTSSLINHLELEYRIGLWESSNKKHMLFFGGQIAHDYDMFMKSYQISGFGQLGFEF